MLSLVHGGASGKGLVVKNECVFDTFSFYTKQSQLAIRGTLLDTNHCKAESSKLLDLLLPGAHMYTVTS